MSYYVRDIQVQCSAMGFSVGTIDGRHGPKTQKGLQAALESVGGKHPEDIFPSSGLHSIIWHWSGGTGSISNAEFESYNCIVTDRDVKGPGRAIIEGKFSPKTQANYRPGQAASHTKNANTHRIGIAMSCMYGAKESPLNVGNHPVTFDHINDMLLMTARYCKEYGIIPSPYTTLTHAEVQDTLNIRQNAKWDITWLPNSKKTLDPHYVGELLREWLMDFM